VSWHQLVIELGRESPARAEEACLALGAIAVSLANAGDEPLLEPAPGETPLWREIRLKALFEETSEPAILAATLMAVLALPAGGPPARAASRRAPAPAAARRPRPTAKARSPRVAGRRPRPAPVRGPEAR